MADKAELVPVIVGAGQFNDRPADPDQGLDSLGLMAEALKRADADAGGGWLGALDSLQVVAQMSFPALNPLGEALARAIGATPRLVEQTRYPMGDSPILLLNQAANRIGAGETRIEAIVGGEALRTAAHRAAAAASAAGGEKPDLMRAATARVKGYRQSYGLVTPTDVYPLYENGCRAAWGQTLEEAQAESARIWSLMSQVAAANPNAWIRTPQTAQAIMTPGPDNRPIAFPYWKLMVANSSVNQGAGFIVTSLAEARRRGVPEERLIHVGRGAAAHEPDDALARDGYDHSPSMAVSLTRALALNGVGIGDIDHAELYSCFPCVPKMARRVIGWPEDRPATVFGGLTFGGGPIGNYMSHAVASMVDRLREAGGKGLLFANGGYATHNHSIILSKDPVPAGTFPHDYDFQVEADAMRGPLPPIDEAWRGPGEIETYSVIYGRAGEPRFGVVVARNPAGARFLARVPASDAAAIALLTDGAREAVGSRGEAVDGADGLAEWRVA